ncbi:hypothetical protein QFZ62_002638 [Clavibacter sp. B3I6]|uniref:hypothetical protein n=1 Tax=Clavibacter sp. B3I6 TaxID=3042268 RepID=UPI0027828938|nr:hypothetical protein [Clavibacter sp. B3I6]MDQ0745330.1 hypothetical protein [Clavibacter sp. B3I6]
MPDTRSDNDRFLPVQAIEGARPSWLSRYRMNREDRMRPKDPTNALQPGSSPLALATMIRGRFYTDRHWARIRRSHWSAGSTLLRVSVFTMSVLAIVFLGIADLDGFAIAGFICTATGTAVSALEGFFNWRARWIAADAALASWHRAEEELELYVASRREEDLDPSELLAFDLRRKEAWSEMSQTWLNERRRQNASREA